MIAAYLTSLLAHQYLLHEEKGFLDRHPHPWLAWEPGNWVAPASSKDAMFETQLPEDRLDQLPAKGEALCFELTERKPQLSVGRNADCDICISDATVSRSHLKLELQDRTWRVRLAAGAKASLSGFPLPAEELRSLSSKERISLGGVELTFLSPADLAARIAGDAAKLRK